MINSNNKAYVKLKKSDKAVPDVVGALLIEGENVIGMYASIRAMLFLQTEELFL